MTIRFYRTGDVTLVSRMDSLQIRSVSPRHGRPCAGHPDAVKRHVLPIGITGTGPVMTG
jgi:hypothetical protein